MPLTPWVIRLLVANVVVFVATYAMPRLEMSLFLIPAFVMDRPWTLVTYMFLHAGFQHIFFNMLMLMFFGPRLEARLSGNQFLWLYLLSGVSGGVLSCVPILGSPPLMPIVGASGAVFGVLVGYAMFWPRDRISIMGILPVPAWGMVVLYMAIDLFGGLGGRDNVAHFAHLGGAAGGFGYLKLVGLRAPSRKFQAQQQAPRSRGDVQRWSKIQREGMHEVNRAELDRIMEKIDERGVASLTNNERTFLDTFADRSSS